MDAFDKKILAELVQNSRIALSALAKKVNMSRETVSYRIKQLEKRGVILKYVAHVDIGKLGYIGAAVFVATKTHRDKEFRKFLATSPNICWVGEHVGVWDFGMSILGKNSEELDRNFSQLYRTFKDFIIDHRFTLHKKNHYFYEKLFAGKPMRTQARKHASIRTSAPVAIDALDKRILRALVEDARADYVGLTRKVPLSAPAIKARIRRLEQAGVIERYSVFLDYAKLSTYQYSIFITNKNLDESPKLLAYLQEHPDVCFICEYIGDPFIEFGVFVDDPYKLRGILQVIEESFPDNRIMEISLQKELVSAAPAACVFE